MKKTIVQHVVGMSGQVAAVLPLFVVTIYLTRTEGLAAAGLFTVLVGVSAATYSTAFWALRSSIILDRFERSSATSYFAARVLSIVVAACVAGVIGRNLNIPVGLVLLVIMLRSCDGILDLGFATTQVWRDTQSAIVEFATMHVLKLGIILAAIAAGLLVQHSTFMVSAIVMSAALYLFTLIRLWRSIAARDPAAGSLSLFNVWQVFLAAFWFAISAAVCALLTSAPRISLAWLYEGDTLGVVGVSLSVSTFFGMAFYTTWVRHVAGFSDASNFSGKTLRFAFENSIIAVLAIVAAWFVLPPIVGAIFEFSAPEFVELARGVLAGSVVFFAAMNMCNLYKPTAVPWMEAVTYFTALAIAVAAAIVLPLFQQIEYLLLLAGCVMFLLSLGSLVAPKKTQRN